MLIDNYVAAQARQSQTRSAQCLRLAELDVREAQSCES